MTPAAILELAAADGVHLSLSTTGTIKVSGEQATVNRWLPIIREHKPVIVAELTQAANETAAVESRGWLLHFAGGDPLEAWFAPAVNGTEARAAYPEAVAAEPIPAPAQQAPTKIEAAELRSLVEVVYAADAEADRAEAMAAALSDPSGALPCYRAICADMGKTSRRFYE